MEEIHLPASASAETQLTRWNSLSDADSSSLTTENFEDILQSKGDTLPCQCTAWANEKHDQYLNRLEASFVKQLDWSTPYVGWCSEQIKDLERNNASEQVTVLIGGCWQKIKYGKTTNVGSHDFLRNTSVKNLECVDKPCSTRIMDLNECCNVQQEDILWREQKKSFHGVEICPGNLLVNHTYYYVSYGSDAESSGQNFIDEDCEDETRHPNKKLKTDVAVVSSGDQMVPAVMEFAAGNMVAGDMQLEEQTRLTSSLEDYLVHDHPQLDLESSLSGA